MQEALIIIFPAHDSEPRTSPRCEENTCEWMNGITIGHHVKASISELLKLRPDSL
jgi:hypothetical protein